MEKKDEERYVYFDSGRKTIKEFINGGRVKHFLLNQIYHLGFIIQLISTPEGWEFMKNPRARKFLYNREPRTGLLEGSIIRNPLHVPSQNNSLEKLETKGWNFFAYDHYRISEFGKKVPRKFEGRIYSFLLEEIKNNPKEKYTPTKTLQIFSLEDMIMIEKPSTDYLVENGLIEETNYREAYKKLKIYQKYSKSIEVLGIGDEELFQVTPKGNGLIFLGKDGGEKAEKKSRVREFKPAIEMPS